MIASQPRTIPINRYPFTPGGYPGIRPKFSFLLSSEGVVRLKPRHLDRFLAERNLPARSSRYGILAYGSNACPSHLVAKRLADVPVLYGQLVGAAAVYTARKAKGGYVPATLARMPGSRSSWVTLLTAEQLNVMDASEGRPNTYALAVLQGVHFFIKNLELFPLYSYVDIRGGVMIYDGNVVPLRSASQRRAKAMLRSSSKDEANRWLDFSCIPNLTAPQECSRLY